jgi:hypothetical protein
MLWCICRRIAQYDYICKWSEKIISVHCKCISNYFNLRYSNVGDQCIHVYTVLFCASGVVLYIVVLKVKWNEGVIPDDRDLIELIQNSLIFLW